MVTDANECNASEIVWINVPLSPGVELGEDMEITIGDTAVLHAIVDVPYDSLSSVTWSGLDDPDCPGCLDQPVAPIITTTYSIAVVSTDGCRGEDALTVFVDDERQLYAPNVFSPNGDGINDFWGLYGPGIAQMTDAQLRIYNRWGGIVYRSADFTNPANLWDGTTRSGRQVSPDVFVWMVEYVDEEGQFQRLVGDVTLVR